MPGCLPVCQRRGGRELHGCVDSCHHGQREGRRQYAGDRDDGRPAPDWQLHNALVELRHRNRCVTSQLPAYLDTQGYHRHVTNWPFPCQRSNQFMAFAKCPRSDQESPPNSGTFDIYSGKRRHSCLTNWVTERNKYPSTWDTFRVG